MKKSFVGRPFGMLSHDLYDRFHPQAASGVVIISDPAEQRALIPAPNSETLEFIHRANRACDPFRPLVKSRTRKLIR